MTTITNTVMIAVMMMLVQPAISSERHDLAINIEQENIGQENIGAMTVLFTHYGEGKEENQK
jgi:hypothetical protein